MEVKGGRGFGLTLIQMNCRIVERGNRWGNCIGKSRVKIQRGHSSGLLTVFY